ncbi:PAS domain S-box protein [Bacillus sp. AK128]
MSDQQTAKEKQTSLYLENNDQSLLYEKLNQYEIMFEQSLDAIVLFKNEKFFYEVNKAACQLFECSKDELTTRELTRFLLLESEESHNSQMSLLKREGELKGDFTIRLANGKVKYIEFSARKNAIQDVDIWIMRDVSAKKNLEKQRNLSKQLFMDVYNRAVDGIVIFDRQGKFINSNQSFMNSFELSKEALQDSNLYEFVENEYLYKLEKLWSILDEKDRAQGELPVILKNGTRKIFEFTTTANIFDNFYMSIMRDVTEKKLMERRLQKSELRFREIFDTALDAIVIWDQAGRVIRANNSASKTFEMPLELLSKHHIYDFVNKQSVEFIKMNKELLETGKVRAELDFFMINGQVKRLEFTSRYRVLDGYNMTIFRNVSETRLMEKGLREKEQKFRKIFEGSIEGIVLADENLSIIDVNSSASKILKMDREQLLSKTINQVIPFTSPKLFNDQNGGEGYSELPLTLDNGEERIIELAIKREVIPGLSMVIFRDVTERKNIERNLIESEHKFRQLYDNSLNGFIILRDDGNIVDMNPEAKRIFMISEELPSSFNKFQELTIKGGLDKGKWRDLLSQSQLHGHFVLEERIIEYTLSKNIYKDHHLAILHDVTERKAMEEKLRKSDTLNVVGELAAGIAHEIRNPMTALKGFIHLLQGSVKEDFSMYFDVITSELKRIETIITEFLILSKPQAINYQQHNLLKIVSETLDLLTPQAVLENIQFQLDVIEQIPDIYCEPNQLKQVFINILKNGLEVMSEGGLIHVTLTRVQGEMVRLSFTDQGTGIPADKLKRLGEPFYTTKERGTGLGLMVSYKIIAEHNGRIEVESIEGEGTTFHLYLPFRQST